MKKNKQLVEELLKIKNLISTHKWLQNAFARNKEGLTVDPKDKKAVSFCLLGAIDHFRVSSSVEGFIFNCAMRHAIERQIQGRVITIWNDQIAKTKQDVLDVLERAIQDENQKGD